jgi:hypothetical protein
MAQRSGRARAKLYGAKVCQALVQLWEMMDYACGKRLVAILPELITKLEQFKELELEAGTKEKLLKLSAATADRLLQPERRKYKLRGS